MKLIGDILCWVAMSCALIAGLVELVVNKNYQAATAWLLVAIFNRLLTVPPMIAGKGE